MYLPWIVWFLATLFYVFQYVLRASPGIMMPHILAKYHVDAYQFGVFSGAYSIGYALAHIPIGLLLDRYGSRVVITISILISILGLTPLIISDNWHYAVLGRFLVGVGSSGAILGVFHIIQTHFPERWFSRLLGISVTLGLLGAMYGGAPLHRLVQHYSWQSVLQYLIIAGTVLAVLVLVVTPSAQTRPADKASVCHDLKVILTNRAVLLTALCAALMVGILEVFADVWGIGFFEVAYQITRESAACLISFIFFGMCIGSSLLPLIAEKFKIYRQLVLITAVTMTLLFLVVLLTRLDIWSLRTLLFVLGVCSAYQILVVYLNILNAPPQYSGLVTSTTNMIVMAFPYIFHSIIGGVMTRLWDGQCQNGAPVYQVDTYMYALSVFPVALTIAFMGFVWLGYLKPVNAKSSKDALQ